MKVLGFLLISICLIALLLIGFQTKEDNKEYKETREIGGYLIFKDNGNVGISYPEGCEKKEWWETGVPMNKVDEYNKCIEENSKTIEISSFTGKELTREDLE